MTQSAMRQVRQLALKALYEGDSTDHDPERVFERLLFEAETDWPGVTAPGPSGYGRGAVRGVVRRCDELDELISGAATVYPLETMAVVDRNILRLAIWELLTDRAAPVGAVVNEAVELAHRYSSDSSPGFINGVLRTVSERIRGEGAPSGEPEPSPVFHHSQQPQEN